MILNKIGYGYNDLTIVPATKSKVKSRKDVNPFDINGNLPIFASPMACVVDDKNFKLWENNKIIPILPRNIDYDIRIDFLNRSKWVAFSLDEFYELFIDSDDMLNTSNKLYVLIDVANGHMHKLGDFCRIAKEKFGESLVLMCGNIANPDTYTLVCEAGVDYVRCSIGSGSCCTTSSNTAIHYPIATLIDDIYEIKREREKSGDFCTKIIADGGIRNFNDINKALALGADYVMIGGLFCTILESSGHIIEGRNYIDHYSSKFTKEIEIIKEHTPNNVSFDDKIILKGSLTKNREMENIVLAKKTSGIEVIEVPSGDFYQFYYIIDNNNLDFPEILKRKIVDYNNMKKECYGMSTKRAQKLIKDTYDLKTAEGISKVVDVKYTMKQWAENMEAYLRSAMSYCNSFNLNDFIGKQKLIINSPSEILGVNK